MTSDRTILIPGVTGNQGGAVAQAQQGSWFHLRCLTRKPDSEHATTLTRDGGEVAELFCHSMREQPTTTAVASKTLAVQHVGMFL